MLLNESVIRTASTVGGPVQLHDGEGLYLMVHADGSRLWRWDYRRPESRKLHTLALGTYPSITLDAAREKRDALLKVLHSGMDPSLYSPPRTPRQRLMEHLAFLGAVGLLLIVIYLIRAYP